MQKNGAKSAKISRLLLQKNREWGMILALNVEATRETFAYHCRVCAVLRTWLCLALVVVCVL